MEKFVIVFEPTEKIKKKGNPRGPRPKVCDRCSKRKIKCEPGAVYCQNCEKAGLICSFQRRNDIFNKRGFIAFDKRDENSKSLVKISNSRAELDLINDKQVHNKFSILRSNKVNLRKGLWYLYSYESGGRYFYLGNSMASFYFISNSYMLVNKKEIVTERLSMPLPIIINTIQKRASLNSTLIFKLVIIYFKKINLFFPTVDSKLFFKLLKKGDQSYPFLTLLTAVCLSGISYYPELESSKEIANTVSELYLFYLNKCYLKPNYLTVQACLIASYHTSLSNNDPVLNMSWRVLGHALRMGVQLGLHVGRPRQKKTTKSRQRDTYYIGCAADIILSYCFGRTSSYCELNYKLRWINKRSIDLRERKSSGDFIKNRKKFIESFYRLMDIMMKVNVHLNPLSKPHLNKFSLSCILNDAMHINAKDFTSYKEATNLENDLFSWYLCYFNLSKEEGFGIFKISNDYETVNALYFFSLLVDLNRPYITSSNEIRFQRSFIENINTISINEFKTFNSLEKALIASTLGSHILKLPCLYIVDSSLPLHWYSFLQFCFIFMLILDRYPKSHWLHIHYKEHLKLYFKLFSSRSKQWAIMKDIFYVSEPLFQSYIPELSKYFKNN